MTLLIGAGAGLTVIWGIAHLFPTANVVRDFGDISRDNQRIITMEWIIEGATLIFIGLLVLLVLLVGDGQGNTAEIVYLASAGMLLVLALISLLTGFSIKFLPFRLCPFIFSASAIMILVGAFA